MSSPDPSSNQHYNLKWTNHTNNILQMFAEHLQKEQLVDVTLSCEGQFLKAHKMVLSACSPYFQELFKIHTVKHPLIIMNGVKFSTLQQMIEFMYQGEIKVGDVDLDNLLTLAENMQIKGLCKIRREKHTGGSDILKMQTESVQNTNITSPKGRKRRRKRSQSPQNNSSESSSSESQINGEQHSLAKQLKNVVDSDKEVQKPEAKLPKSKQKSLTQETLPEDKTIDKQGTKIPRPPNAFMIFANEWRKKLAVEHQGESNKEISVRLGNMWKSLPGTTKDLYYTAARKADEDHKVKYPGYYYSPKEARLRKEMRGSSAQKSQSTGIMRDIDSTSLVRLIMPDPGTEPSSADEVQPEEIKGEPGSNDEFENESNENDDNSNSSIEHIADTTKE